MDQKMSEQLLNIEFVKEVENFPCIYDYRRADYSRKDVIEQSWAQIGTKFNLSGPQCRERWKNLRTVLSRNLAKPNKNGKSRSSKQQRKPYYLFDAMKFAVPFIKSLNTVPTYCRPKESSNSHIEPDEKFEENEKNEVEMPEGIAHVKVETNYYDQSRTPSPCVSPPPSTRNLRQRKPRKQFNHIAEVETDENVSKNVKSKKPKNKVKPDLTKISKKRFLLSLLSDVYSMDNSQMRSFRIKILNVINEITQTPSSLECKCHAATSNQGSRQTLKTQKFNVIQGSRLSLQTQKSNVNPGQLLQSQSSNVCPGLSLQSTLSNEVPGPSHQTVSSAPSEQLSQNLNSACPQTGFVVIKVEKED